METDGYISFVGNYGEDPLIKWEIENVDKNLIKYYTDIIVPKIPIKVELEKDIEVIDPYMSLNYVHEMYTNSYFNIITETAYNWDSSSVIDNNIYLTEKTLKSIFGMQPFIVVTNPGFLKYLKSMGFKTYPEFFDESYDEIENPIERMNIIVREIQKICILGIKELRDRYYSIFDKLEHNRNRLIEIVDDRKMNYGNYLDVFE